MCNGLELVSAIRLYFSRVRSKATSTRYLPPLGIESRHPLSMLYESLDTPYKQLLVNITPVGVLFCGLLTVSKKSQSNSLSKTVRLQVCHSSDVIDRFNDRLRAGGEALSDSLISASAFEMLWQNDIWTYQSHTRTQHLTETVKTDNVSSSRGDLCFQLEVGWGSVDGEEIYNQVYV